MAELGDFITSKVRIKILELLYSDVTEMYHVRGIVREIKEEINAVRRELKRLEEAGIVRKEGRGNRGYYWGRPDYPLFGDFVSMINKLTGLGKEIINNKAKLGRLNYVMFSGRFARHKEPSKEDEVDVLVVGDIVLAQLATLIRVEESKRGREINYTVMSRDELEFRKKRRDPFLLGIMGSGRVMVWGDEEGLVS